MQLGIGPSISKVATTMRTFVVGFLKDNLKLFFNFQNTDFEHVGRGSASFDGSNDVITISDNSVFSFGDGSTDQGFSITAWVKMVDATNFQIINKGIFNTDGEWNFRTNSSDQLVFALYDESVSSTHESVVSSAITSNQNQWIHVAATYDGRGGTSANDGMELYINGVNSTNSRSGAGTYVAMENLAGNVTIGAGNSAFANGSIAQVGIWQRQLSSSEILNIVYKEYSDLSGTELTHLFAWYPLLTDADSLVGVEGLTKYDGSNSGATFNSSVYGNNAPPKPRGVDNSSAALADSIGSGSASFDGSNDYVNCGLLDFNTDDISIVAWYKANAFDDPNSAIVNNRDSDTGTGKKGIQIRVDSGGDDIELFTDCGSTTFSTKTDSFVPVVGVWTHVAATIDRSALQSLYIDGVLQATTDISGESSTDITNTDNLEIGRDESSNFFDGNIAQVGIWVGRVLTQEEIQSISQKQYSELTTSEKTNLSSWLALDEVFLGSNTSTSSVSSSFYEGGQIVEDKAGTLSTILVDNYDTLDNWEGSNANSSLSRNADGNLVITASGGSAGARLKSSFTTLETDTMYLAELAVAGGTDTSIYFRLDDEAYADTKYGNGYLTPNTDASNATPECMSVRFKSDSTNTGLYVQIGNIDDTKTAIIKSFKLYKIVSGNYGVLTDV